MFEEFNLPWTNLLLILMDSCAVTRGSKSGLETRIRANKAPHLLDVDGDSCHHAHNAAKTLCEPFGYHLEGLIKDFHTDFMWSAESHQEICQILRRAVTGIYTKHKLSKEARQQVVQERKRCLNKSGMTKEGTERKRRTVNKLRVFICRKTTELQLSFFMSVLPLLQKYAKTFKMTEPLIFKLNDYQAELLNDFLVCFIRPQVLTKAEVLGDLDVRNPTEVLRGHSETLRYLLKLTDFAKHVISDAQTDEFELDCRRYAATKQAV
ncbi:uncharacterized protein [Diadema antillarum]|uniref:uncharacterized protein n=1 Tax=Diadema antillarum TaxID=105358 RepID=UPI003A851735